MFQIASAALFLSIDAFVSGIVKELAQNGVVHDVRKLHVGDFGWIAQEKTVAAGVYLNFFFFFLHLVTSLLSIYSRFNAIVSQL